MSPFCPFTWRSSSTPPSERPLSVPADGRVVPPLEAPPPVTLVIDTLARTPPPLFGVSGQLGSANTEFELQPGGRPDVGRSVGGRLGPTVEDEIQNGKEVLRNVSTDRKPPRRLSQTSSGCLLAVAQQGGGS